MLPSDEVKIEQTLINIFEMSENIYKLCTGNLDKEDKSLYSKISDIYTERSKSIEYLQVIGSTVESEAQLKLFFNKNTKEIQKIVDLDGMIIEILAKKKIEMAQELRNIQLNKNVLIYKKG